MWDDFVDYFSESIEEVSTSPFKETACAITCSYSLPQQGPIMYINKYWMIWNFSLWHLIAKLRVPAKKRGLESSAYFANMSSISFSLGI